MWPTWPMVGLSEVSPVSTRLPPWRPASQLRPRRSLIVGDTGCSMLTCRMAPPSLTIAAPRWRTGDAGSAASAGGGEPVAERAFAEHLRRARTGAAGALRWRAPAPAARTSATGLPSKDSAINQEVDRLRHAATAAVFARRDVIVVASVSCIYGLGSPETYEMNMQILRRGEEIDREKLLRKLVSIQYTRNDTVLARGTFRVKGETLEVFPAYAETAFRATLFGDEVERLQHFDPLTGELIADDLEHVAIWPATHYNVKEGTIDDGVAEIGTRAERALRAARGRRQAARVSPAASAHPVRHGDAARDGLLLGDRELFTHPRWAQAGRAALLPDRLLPRGLRVLHRRVPPDGAADRRHVRG